LSGKQETAYPSGTLRGRQKTTRNDMAEWLLKQYEHAARMMAEVGRLLGAWLKQVSGSSASS